MKAAVSIPDEIFDEAEDLAVKLKTSRSRLYSRALAEFIARHGPERVTASMNRAIEVIGDDEATTDPFMEAAAQRALERTEW